MSRGLIVRQIKKGFSPSSQVVKREGGLSPFFYAKKFSCDTIHLTESFNALPAVNLRTFLAAILIGLPVDGLLPVLADRFVTEKVPNPIRVTLSSYFSAFFGCIKCQKQKLLKLNNKYLNSLIYYPSKNYESIKAINHSPR